MRIFVSASLIAAMALTASNASAQVVPPPSGSTTGTGSLCRARTNGVFSQNPVLLTQTSPAVFDGSWDTQVDVTGFNPGFVILFVAREHRRFAMAPIQQVILFDPATVVLRPTAPHDGITPVQFSIPIPNDPSLCDRDAWVQAAVFDGSGVPTMSNGLHVYLGN